ncbi:hypothetical protein EMGBS3_15690 [Anaerolineaceae bacterium]|nr:hypothetical protein EMGBS3_15690 [Anaerolineaceae bacterium]
MRDQHNELVSPDDARLDALWAAAGELRLPVMAHVADPVAFFDPLDATNERWKNCTRIQTGSFPRRHSRPFLIL